MRNMRRSQFNGRFYILLRLLQRLFGQGKHQIQVNVIETNLSGGLNRSKSFITGMYAP